MVPLSPPPLPQYTICVAARERKGLAWKVAPNPLPPPPLEELLAPDRELLIQSPESRYILHMWGRKGRLIIPSPSTQPLPFLALPPPSQPRYV